MKCSRCQHDNRPGAKFCEECAAPLESACGNCGTLVSSTAKFCPECTYPVGKAAASNQFDAPAHYTPKHLADKILTTKAALEGERKQVTVLFCDIANSTLLTTSLGAEQMHAPLNRFFGLALEVLHRYEGAINQFLGDGFMTLFGAPISHEDHALRAVRAALDIRQTLRDRQRELLPEGDNIAVRMGLNSGLVVVGKIGDNLRMDYTAVGDTTNIAAREILTGRAAGSTNAFGPAQYAENAI
jgi:class 3 adenylate cyclase